MLGLRGALAAIGLAAAFGVHAMAPLPADAPGLEAAADLLVPQGVIPGGFAAAPTQAPGMGRAPGGEFIKLVFPSAVAATGLDLFVFDSASGALLRIDAVTHSVARLSVQPLMPGVRIAAGPDGSVYLLRPDRGEVERFTRDGQSLPSFASPPEILRPADLVIEPRLNRVWIADAAGAVFAFHPSGRMSGPVVGRRDGFPLREVGVTVLAAGPNGVVGIDPRCRCLFAFDSDGLVVGQAGEGELVNPVALAVDHYGRSWVLDRGDGRLKVFEGEFLAFSVGAGRLGLSELTAIAIDHQRVYLADGPGGKIGVFALLPPRRTP